MNRRGNLLLLYNKAHYGYEIHSELMNYTMPIVLSLVWVFAIGYPSSSMMLSNLCHPLTKPCCSSATTIGR